MQVRREAQGTQGSQKPEEVIKMPPVEIVWEPALSDATGHLVNGVHKKATDEAANPSYAQVQRAIPKLCRESGTWS